MSRPETQSLSSTEPHESPCITNRFGESNSSSHLELSVHGSLNDLEADWLEFEKRSRCSPFQRFSWIEALYQGFVKKNSDHKRPIVEPFLVTGRIENKLVFILPLYVEKNLFGKYLKWVGSEVSDYNGMILDADYAVKMPDDLFDQILEAVEKHNSGLDAIYLKRNFASQTALAGERVSSWQTEYGSHTLELSRDWNSLYSTIRSKKSKQRLKSKFRALKKTGKIRFQQVRGLDERIQVTRQILSWKSSQLKGRGSRNPFGSNDNPSQTRTAIFASVEDDNETSAKVFGMYRNDELVAGMLAFISDGKFFYLVSAYSPEVSNKFSIGTQMLVKTLELASRSGLRQYDFLLGDETYKFDWCDTKVHLVNHLIPFSLKGRIFETGIRAGFFLKRLVLQSPLLSSLGRKLNKTRDAKIFMSPKESI